MAARPDPITVEQFRQMPEDGRAYELHHGEVVCVSSPKAKHYNMQEHLAGFSRLNCRARGAWEWSFPIGPWPSSTSGSRMWLWYRRPARGRLIRKTIYGALRSWSSRSSLHPTRHGNFGNWLRCAWPTAVSNSGWWIWSTPL